MEIEEEVVEGIEGVLETGFVDEAKVGIEDGVEVEDVLERRVNNEEE